MPCGLCKRAFSQAPALGRDDLVQTFGIAFTAVQSGYALFPANGRVNNAGLFLDGIYLAGFAADVLD